MIPDGFNVGHAGGQGHPRAHRTAVVARQQHLGLAPHHVIGALPAHGDAITVVYGFWPIDAHGQTKTVGVQIVHRLLGEQGGVGGHDKFDELASLAKTLLAVIDHVLDQFAIAQWLAAEEHYGEALLVRGLLEQHFHRGNGCLDVHLLARRGLVQIFLVAIGATQVAAGIDVQYHGIDRRTLDPLDAYVRG
ncbi:hypothetical protein D3C84_76410 [compost metagenome]